MIVFQKQPVTFIRIVGTHNTANEVRQSLAYYSLYLLAFKHILTVIPVKLYNAVAVPIILMLQPR